jgi:hypothetical protein
MGTNPIKPKDPAQHTRRDTVISVVGAVVVLAAIAYKFAWPWSSLRSDLVVLGIIVVGIVIGTVLKRSA